MSYLDLDFKLRRQKTNRKNSAFSIKLIKPGFYYAAAFALVLISLILLYDSSPSDDVTSANIDSLSIPATDSVSTNIVPLAIPATDNVSTNIVPLVIPTTDDIKTPSPQQIKEPIKKEGATLSSVQTITIKHGDTLSSMFDKQGIQASVLFQLIAESEHGDLLKRINIGQKFHFHKSDSNQFIKLQYQPSITNIYTFTKGKDNRFFSVLEVNPLDAIPVFRQGVIESSLFLAASNNNIPVNVIMNLVGIFGWDIDFALDIRKGDHFKLIYNELYQDGIKIKTGQILAAEFTNRNNTYQAVFYKDSKGNGNYFSPDGKSMRKAFLRNPVKFSRISSRFTNKRWHPVLSKWRSHKGVDYAASRGTPVYAAGDGRIIHAGNKGGYGRAVIIQHGGKYTTLYAHLNSYSKYARRGKRVKQGQVIGYVGSSGLATGPHLHYEFRVSGVHRNPLTVKLPAAQPINKKYKDDFIATKNKRLNMLKLMSNH